MTIKKLFWISLLFIASSAQAMIDIVLTKGVDNAIPMVIEPFKGDAQQAKNELEKVIKHDLSVSGQFRLVNFPGYDVGMSYWQDKGVEHLLKAEVNRTDDNQLRININLYNVYGTNNLVLSRAFTIQANQERSLAHHISDLVYEQLTGTKGIFSTRLAYVVVKQPTDGKRQYRLEMADYDGYNPRTLLTSTQPIMSPSWSPNGKDIAYVSFEKRRAEVYIQNIATGKRSIFSGFSGVNGAPAWSPDGKTLAVVLTKTGFPKIYTIDIRSGKTTQRTTGYAIDTEPTFTPDGNAILFTSNRSGGPQIYRLALNTGKITRETYTGNYNTRASVTPDNKELIVLHRSNNGFNIAVQDIKTGRLKVITKERNNQSPSVAPNGKMVLFSSQQKNRTVLGIVSSDGKVRIDLPAREGDVRDPAWSPIS